MIALFLSTAFAEANCPLAESPVSDIQQVQTTDLPSIFAQAKGCSTLIEIWASWCGPCVTIAPYMVKFKDAHPNVEIISVSADSTLGEMKHFLKTHPTPGTKIHLTQWSIAELEHVFSPYDLSFPGRIPYLVWLNPDGSVYQTLTEPSVTEFSKWLTPVERPNAP